jgi:hypothetical protein
VQVRGDPGRNAGNNGLLGGVLAAVQADGEQAEDGNQAEGCNAEGNGDLDK